MNFNYAYNHSYDKRKELRFPLSAPAVISAITKREQKTAKARIEDVSLFGIKSSSNAYFEPGSRVSVLYEQLNGNNGKDLQGEVKWCEKKNSFYYLGIKMFQQNNPKLSLTQLNVLLSKLYSASDSSSSTDKKIKDIIPEVLSPELYWGLMFKTFRHELQKTILQLSSELSLNSAQVEIILKNTSQEDSVQKRLSDAIQNTKKLNRSLDKIFELAALFNRMDQEKLDMSRQIQEGRKEIIDLQMTSIKRVNAFKKQLKSLESNRDTVVSFENSVASNLYGLGWKIELGLDIMILYLYQSLIFGNGNHLRVNLDEDSEGINLEFHHNGSAMLPGQEKYFLFNPHDNKPNTNSDFLLKLTWLGYALSFFDEHKPLLRIFSEHGNNLVLLTLRKGKSLSGC